VTTQDVGDRVNVRYNAIDANGVFTDATVALTVTDPDGNDTTPSVTHTSTGVYDASFDLDAEGTWNWRWNISGTLVDVSYGSVYAANPGPQNYGSMAVLRKSLNIPATGTDFDDLLQMALDAASEDIEDYCDGRVFWLARTATSRVFSTRRTLCLSDGYRLPLFDGKVNCIGVTDATVEVSSDGTTWTAMTDFALWPKNALAQGEPAEALWSKSTDWRNWLEVRVTTRWGSPSTPATVNQATNLHASRFFHRKDSPDGVAGTGEWGIIRVPFMDPDVKRMLARWHSEFLAA
jgi:hypothetical protein